MHRQIPTAEVGKILFVEKRKTAYWRMHESGWGVGFIAFFALPGSRDVSQVQTEVSWEGEVSL
jgi:hypothetical protein